MSDSNLHIFEIDGCSIHMNRNIMKQTFFNKNILVLFDDFMFNIDFFKQFQWAENLMFNNNVKIVGASTKLPNIHYEKIISGDLTTKPYFIYPIYFSDVGNIDTLSNFINMKYQLDEFI
jgi:hypothetical protein